MLVDLRVAQLLCSRICHDLVGPAGAVNAGLEIMEEEGQGETADSGTALALAGRSAKQLTRRLAFFRFAFGMSGGSTTTLAELRELADGLLEGGKVGLDWPPGEGRLPSVPALAGKLLLNVVLLGAESLPRGGTLNFEFAELAEGIGIALTATGDGARLRDGHRAVMGKRVVVDELTAQTVQAHFASRLAESLGTSIEISRPAEGEIHFAAILPGKSGSNA